ncbi:MAG: hydroxyethylthiazole kinase [Oscillospiraceae bacterium]
MIEQLLTLKNLVKKNQPLIHCITNPISINQCANAVLAVGGKPIMAEHPMETAEITISANALALSLGNVTDARLKSMIISAKAAKNCQIPCVLDLVGVGCSTFRYNYARDFIRKNHPDVIKGNLSEIKAIAGKTTSAKGVDVGKNDVFTEENSAETIATLKKLSRSSNSVVLATGKTDVIVYFDEVFLVENGDEMLSKITGTGCILNVLVGTFISAKEILLGTILAAATLGIAGELADKSAGTGTFSVNLLDALYSMSDSDFVKLVKIRKV